MIIKSLSVKSVAGVQRLVKYIFKKEKTGAIEKESRRIITPPRYVKYDARDVECLYMERDDSILLEQLSAFKGTVQDFINTHLIKDPSKDAMLNSQLFKHNLRGNSLKEYLEEIQQTSRGRIHNRIDGNVALHTVIAFTPSDTVNLTNGTLADLVEHYIELRGNGAVYLGGLHTTEKHIHIHLVQTAVDRDTGLSNRISRTQFKEIKVALQEYQKEQYPELESLPDHKKSSELGKGKGRYNENIFAADRTKAPNINEVARTTFEQSTSISDFMDKMKTLGHVPYYRNGRPQGILADGRTKYRLSRLFDRKELDALDRKNELIQRSKEELHSIRSRNRSLVRGRISAFKEKEDAINRDEKITDSLPEPKEIEVNEPTQREISEDRDEINEDTENEDSRDESEDSLDTTEPDDEGIDNDN